MRLVDYLSSHIQRALVEYICNENWFELAGVRVIEGSSYGG